jgi:hypothetical protein
LQHRQHNFAADGSRLYFQTTKALVPQDHNGATDVYEWSSGQVRLLSGGSGEGGSSEFMGASPSGNDVFITTRDRLVGQDKRPDSDVYDARVDGGLAGQDPADPSPPCSGEACHGLPSGPTALPVVGSVTFSGTGNAATTRPPVTVRAKVTKPKTIRGSAGTLQITVPGAGKLALSGSGLRTATKTAAEAGTYKVTVALTKKATSTLRKRHRLTATARVAFTPTGGKRATVTVRVTFVQPKAKVKQRSAVSTSSGRGR